MRLQLHQLRAEQTLLAEPRPRVFTFPLPIVFYLPLDSIYGDEESDGLDGDRFLLAA